MVQLDGTRDLSVPDWRRPRHCANQIPSTAAVLPRGDPFKRAPPPSHGESKASLRLASIVFGPGRSGSATPSTAIQPSPAIHDHLSRRPAPHTRQPRLLLAG